MHSTIAIAQRSKPIYAVMALVLASGLGGCANNGVMSSLGGATGAIATATTPTQKISADQAHSGVAGWNGDISAPGYRAAHRSLPIGSTARLTNLETGQSTTVLISTNAAPRSGRDLDLSRDAAAQVGALESGSATVLIEPLPNARSTVAPRPQTAAVAQPSAVSYPTARALPSSGHIQTGSIAQPAPASLPPYDPNLSTASIPLEAATGSDLQSPARAGLAGVRYIQIGSFKDADNAQRQLTTLARQGLAQGVYGKASIEPTYIGGQLYHRVRLGPIPNADLAMQALSDARDLGHAGAKIMTP